MQIGAGMGGYFQAERGLLEIMAKDGELTAADFRVMLLAMRDTRLPGDTVPLGIDYLAAGTGLHRSTVVSSRRHLVGLGYLMQHEAGRRGLSRFTIATGSGETTCRVEATCRPGTTGTGSVETTGTSSVEATQIETGNKETTAPCYFSESAPEEKPKTRKAKPKANQSPAWLLWLQVNQDAGQPPPLEEKASFAAARKLAEQIPNPDEQEAIMRAYIGDRGDKWAISQGLTLAVLVNSRLSKCRAVAARAIEEQTAEDAALIAEAEQEYPDPDERAAFFWARKEKSLRVPPGVDCRPLPGEKEAVF